MGLWKWHLFILGLLILGCQGVDESSSPGPAPQPPVPVNAQLPDHRPIDQMKEGAYGDTVIVGRCISSEEYAETVRGDWADHWMLVRVQVLAVERGTWPRRQSEDDGSQPHPPSLFEDLLFIAWDEWPTPESGIMVDNGPWAYRINSVYAFTLDTSTSPATIVGQEHRRVADPAKPFVLMKLSANGHGVEVSYSKIHDAARAYLSEQGQQDMKRHVLVCADETADAYFVISRADPNLPILAVDKKDFTVRPIPWSKVGTSGSPE